MSTTATTPVAPPPPPPDDACAYNLAEVLYREAQEIEARAAADPEITANLNLSPARAADDKRPDRFAIAFSGGGIRSACVSLGIAQSLAKHRVLRQAHYLSAISGGGYFLGWLTAWAKRAESFKAVEKQLGDLPEQKHKSGAYHRYIEPNPIHHLRQYSSYLTPRLGLLSGDSLALISVYLRNLLLNFAMLTSGLMAIMLLLQLLAPQRFWAHPLGATRMLIELAATAVCFFLSVHWVTLALGRIRYNVTFSSSRNEHIKPLLAGILGCALAWNTAPTFYSYPTYKGGMIALISGLVFVGISSTRSYQRYKDQTCSEAGIVPPATTVGKEVDPTRAVSPVNSASYAVLFLAWLGAFVTTALACVIFIYWLRQPCADYATVVTNRYAVLGLPFILATFPLVSYVFLGIMGDGFADAEREWLARFAGFFLAAALAVSIVLGIALEGHDAVHWMFSKLFGDSKWSHKLLTGILPGGWLFVVITGIIGGRAENTDGKERKNHGLSFIVAIAPPVFLAGALLLVSWAAQGTVAHSYIFLTTPPVDYAKVSCNPAPTPPPPTSDATLTVDFAEQGASAHTILRLDQPVSKPQPTHLAPNALQNLCILTGAPVHYPEGRPFFVRWQMAGRKWIGAKLQQQPTSNAPASSPSQAKLLCGLLYFGLFALFTGIATALACRLDVNEFSLHLFYRNRLVRAFLGASVEGRGKLVNKFTGFSVQDDIALSALTVAKGFTGPYPIWGTTLNITKGEDLGWQQRKGASFLYSPISCGWDYVDPTYAPPSIEDPDFRADTPAAVEAPPAPTPPERLSPYGYRATRYYGGIRDNEGQSLIGTAMAASGAAASPNMGYHTRPGVAALLAIFNVRLGWWTGNPRDNEGWKQYAPPISYLLKELLGATDDKSEYVYLSDGGHFENLGLYELIRRRVRFIISSDAAADATFGFGDLGNAIERCRRDFGVEINLSAQSTMDLSDAPPFRSAHYALGEIDYGDFKGILLYLKSSLTDDEPADVLSFQDADSAFPHDSTANQFFTEAMFEAYRALGQHMMDKVFDKCGMVAHRDDQPRDVVPHLYRKLSDLLHKDAAERAPSPRSSSLSSVASTLKQILSHLPAQAKDL